MVFALREKGRLRNQNNTLLWQVFSAVVTVGSHSGEYEADRIPRDVDLRYFILSGNDFSVIRWYERWILDDPFIRREQGNTSRRSLPFLGRPRQDKTVMVRKNDYTAKLDILVLLNIQSRDNEYEDVIDKDLIEYGIKVAATVFDLALKNGARIQFGCNAGTEEDRTKTVLTESDASSNHIQHLLTILSGLVLKNVRYFEEFLKNATENKRDAEILILTSYMNLEMTDIVRDLIRARNRVKSDADPYARAFAMPVGADLYYV